MVHGNCGKARALPKRREEDSADERGVHVVHLRSLARNPRQVQGVEIKSTNLQYP